MAMLKLRDGRELEVAEKVAEILAVADTTGTVCAAVAAIGGTEKSRLAADGSKLVVLHEIRTTVKRKFPTPVDTKAEFEHQVIEHIVNLDHVMDVQPTVAEIELAPVHDRRQADMPAVSGPFKHDFDQHVFDYETVDGRRVQKSVLTLDAECQKDPEKADPHGVKTPSTADDVQ